MCVACPSSPTGNPFPEVASVHFTPANGRASVATRIRLNEGKQEVVAVAELSDGRRVARPADDRGRHQRLQHRDRRGGRL